MLVDTDDLAGPGDLAEEHGISLQLLNYWKKLPGFPEPLFPLSTGPVYSRFAVKEWVVEYRRAKLNSQAA